MTDIKNVAIIGAGLTGLAAALALEQQSILCVVYEARDAPSDIGGTVTLSPNANRILDALGVWPLIRESGHQWQKMYFRKQDDQPIDEVEFGSVPKYGYNALRIFRHVLIAALLRKLADRDIPVKYGQKFTRVLSESGNEVKFEFANGTVGVASSLIGADGIHSRVRRHLYPKIEPIFTNVCAISATAPASVLNIPEESPIPVTIMSPVHGAYMIAPQGADGSDVVVAKQMRVADLGRHGWAKMSQDRAWCCNFLRQGSQDFPPYVGNAAANVKSGTINVWPFYMVPELDSWVSPDGLVAILGDAAHAIPPSTGQGANQVFEDVYTYALILAQSKAEDLSSVLQKWKAGRQERINRLIRFADWMNARRAPKNENTPANGRVDKVAGATASDFGPAMDLDWLFKPDFKDMVTNWLDA